MTLQFRRKSHFDPIPGIGLKIGSFLDPGWRPLSASPCAGVEVPGQQVMDTRHQIAGGDPLRCAPEPGVLLDASHLAGLDQRRHAGTRDGAFVVAGDDAFFFVSFGSRSFCPCRVELSFSLPMACEFWIGFQFV